MRRRGTAPVEAIGRVRASGQSLKGASQVIQPAGNGRMGVFCRSKTGTSDGRTGFAVQASLRARSSENRVHVQSIAGFVPSPR
jgi:hypothetical protein